MLALAEPCIMDSFLDRPHLGCAMLIAACQERGIKITLIRGQTRYLRDMFVNDSEELWNLIQDLKKSDLKRMEISEYKRFIQEKGMRVFQEELKDLYQYVIVDKSPRHYFNGARIEKFKKLHNIFLAVYFYHFETLNHADLKIIERYVSEILKTNPRYIGFSLQDRFGPLSRIIKKRVKELAQIPIIVGGALTPCIDLKKLDKIFENEYFDYLIIGAGEHALPRLVEALENNKEPKGIVNVFYKRGNKIIGNDLEVIDDLDSLPYPNYSQFDLDLYLTPKMILPLQTARGCSWKRCAFCSHHNIDFGNYKTFGIGNVIEVIKHLQSTYGCSHFAFHDEELPPGRARRISEAILNNNLKNICINTYARPVDGYNNSNLLRLMRKAGFTLIHWGIESGCQRVLDLMNKEIRISTVSQILRKSLKNGIVNFCFIFFGFPGETKREARQTVEFLEEHADYIEDVGWGVFSLDSHSPIGRNPAKWGVDIKGDSGYSTERGMSRKEAIAIFSRLDKKFKINSVKITSDRLKYLLPGFNRRMLCFLNSSYKLLTSTTLLEYLGKGRLNSVFPIILGEVKKEDKRTVFLPVNINETCFVNQCHPEKERTLGSFEKRIFILSDGTLSIEDIISTVYKDFKGEGRKSRAHEKCTDFFRLIFSKNWGLGFAKSWRSP